MRLVGLRRARPRLRLQLLGELLDRGVDERPRAVDHPHGPRGRQPAAWPGPSARRRSAGRHVARQAALEPEQPVQVRGQHEPRQVLANEDVHRLVAEARVRRRGRPPTPPPAPRGRAPPPPPPRPAALPEPTSVDVPALTGSRSASSAPTTTSTPTTASTRPGRRAATATSRSPATRR